MQDNKGRVQLIFKCKFMDWSIKMDLALDNNMSKHNQDGATFAITSLIFLDLN